MPDLREFFERLSYLPHKEKIGLITLIIIALLIGIIPYFIKTQSQILSFNYDDYLEQIKKVQSQIDYNQTRKELSFEISTKEQKTLHLNPFPFNPNEFNYNMGKSLGLTERQIQSIIKYLQKGGRFRTKSDFKKMYLISPEEYQVLEPYILLPDSIPKTTYEKNYSSQSPGKIQKIELNSADSLDLLKIKGIGPYFAHKILQYRKRLGGFYNIQQLLEIKGIDSSKLQNFEEFIYVNPVLVRRIDVNQATFDELKAHPYISYNIALSIVNYRKQHGSFKSLDDLKKCKLVTENIFHKILPYLEINSNE